MFNGKSFIIVNYYFFLPSKYVLGEKGISWIPIIFLPEYVSLTDQSITKKSGNSYPLSVYSKVAY
jgi:hypothetical protein